MTVINGNIKDIGLDPLSGVLVATSVRFRTSGDVVIAPESRSFPIAGGVVSVDLVPGPTRLTVQVGSHARDEFDVVVPGSGPVTLATLIDEAFEWTPEQVSRFAQLRDEAVAAAERAESAAENVDDAIAGAADLVVQAVEADRVAAEAASSSAAGSAVAAGSSAGDASSAASAASGSAGDAAGSATAAAGSASGASSSASAAAGSATSAGTARDEAVTAQSGAESAAQVVTDNLSAIEAAPGAAAAAQSARAGAEDARDAAEGHATTASGHASAAALSEQAAGLSEGAADQSEQAASGFAADAQTARDASVDARDESRVARDGAVQARGGAEDERVMAEDAAGVAQGHAVASGVDAGRAEVAAALAESLRWTIRGAWEPGPYEAGDVVVFEERAYYAQLGTDVSPPAQPWVPLTPAGGGGVSHWDDLDGKPSVFPPAPHATDAADVSGDATPLLDVSEASVAGLSVAEWLDQVTDAGVLTGALTDQVDASEAFALLYVFGDPQSASVSDWLGTAFASVEGLYDELEYKADASHTHLVADLSATGAASSATFLRGDGTWATPANTTYSVPSQAEAEAGTATTARTFTAERVRQAITTHPRLAAAPATWHWAGTNLPTNATQVHTQARAGDFIVAPNLTTDPGWHRITGV